MPTSSSAAFYCTLCRTASIASATTVFSPMAPAVTASLSVVACSKTVSRVPSPSLPIITPQAIARSLLLTSPSVPIAVAPCGGSQSCHAPVTHSHSPVTRHDLPTDAHRDRARSESYGQRCLHRTLSWFCSASRHWLSLAIFCKRSLICLHIYRK